jgi:methanethiol S-methyltransferase
MEYFVLFLLWTGFCALHSALVSVAFKSWAQRKMGPAFRFYRLSYNLVALLTLIGVLAYAAPLRGKLVLVWTGAWRLVQFALLAAAALGFALGARAYDLAAFLGWAQIRDGSGHGPMTRSGSLSTRGILGFVRHPWYAAVFPLLWARDLDLASLIGNVVLSGYVVIGAFLEERKLVLEFGDDYRDYRRRVSMFFPWKWATARIMGQGHDRK